MFNTRSFVFCRQLISYLLLFFAYFTLMFFLTSKESSIISTETSICYRLSSIVSNIQDAVGGNTLVAAIHVSENYHERKEVRCIFIPL